VNSERFFNTENTKETEFGRVHVLPGRELDECVKFLASVAGIDGSGGVLSAFKKIGGAARGDNRGGGVGDDDIPARTGLARKNRAEEARVVRRVSSRNRVEGRALQAEIFGRDLIDSHYIAVHVANRCLSSERNFVQPARAV